MIPIIKSCSKTTLALKKNVYLYIPELYLLNANSIGINAMK